MNIKTNILGFLAATLHQHQRRGADSLVRSNPIFAGEPRGQGCPRSVRMLIECGLSVTLVLFASSAHAKLNVVVTTPDLAAIAKEIGKDHIDIATLAKPTEDPHFVDAKPSFIV